MIANGNHPDAVDVHNRTMNSDSQTKLPELPNYEILCELGSGGMGVVYKAVHLALKRVVAIKMIRTSGKVTAEDLARFRIEAEAIARLQHPNIVQIHDIGEHAGIPHFALEYMPGGTLDRRLSGQPIAFRQAAELIEVLARAIHYAHEIGIVHRDLKPGNILLEKEEIRAVASASNEFSTSNSTQIFVGTMKISDFGLAKFFDSKDVGQTESGSILGTPSYMAPEQAKGQTIGPPVDIYALGAILYELITGRPPFRAATAWDTIQQVVTDDPVPPRRMQSKLPSDLNTICMKCLQKLPRQRYGSALALAEDLRHFLDDEPIMARPIGSSERILKWAKRRPSRAALIAVCFLGSLILLASWFKYSMDLSEANTQIREERDHAVQAEEATKNEWNRARRSLYALQLANVSTVYETDPARGLTLLEDRERCPEELRDFSWSLFQQICKRSHRMLTGHTKTVRSAIYSKDGSWLASASYDGTIKVWDLANCKERFTVTGNHGAVRTLAIVDGDKTLLAGMEDGVLQSFSAADGHPTVTLKGHTKGVTALVATADGSKIASASSDGEILLHRGLHDKQPITLGVAQGLTSMAFAPNGKHIATSAANGIVIWDIESRRPDTGPPLKQNAENVMSIAYSADGSMLTTCDLSGLLQWWETKSWTKQGQFKIKSMFLSASFSPDGQSICVSSTTDGTLYVIDVATAKERLRFSGYKEIVWAVSFSPNGQSIAASDGIGNIKIWDVQSKLDATILTRKSLISSVAFSQDSQQLVSGSKDGLITLWECESGKLLNTWDAHKTPVTALAYVPGRNIVAVAGVDGTIKIVKLSKRSSPTVLQVHQKMVLGLSFSPDGNMLASCGQDGSVRVWDWERGNELANVKYGVMPLWCLSYSPDGKTLVVGDSNGVVHLCDPATAVERKALPKRSGAIFALTFNKTGSTLAIGGSDKQIELWNWPDETKRITLQGHLSAVLSLAFPPDGQTLASAADNDQVRVWDLISGQTRLQIPLPHHTVSHLRFSPDGNSLAGISKTKILLWKSNARENR